MLRHVFETGLVYRTISCARLTGPLYLADFKRFIGRVTPACPRVTQVVESLANLDRGSSSLYSKTCSSKPEQVISRGLINNTFSGTTLTVHFFPAGFQTLHRESDTRVPPRRTGCRVACQPARPKRARPSIQFFFIRCQNTCFKQDSFTMPFLI